MFALLFVCLSCNIFASAIESPVPEPFLRGESLSLVVSIAQDESQITELTIENQQPGMTFTRMTKSRYILKWKIPSWFDKPFVITIRGIGENPSNYLATHKLTLRPKVANLSLNVDAELNIVDPPKRSSRPVLPELPTYIVSAGQFVQIDLSAEVEDAQQANLSIDWLPKNGRFELRNDGSRRFVWQTEMSDVGQHLFVFTAQHPENSKLIDITSAIVIVDGSARAGSSASLSPISALSLEHNGNSNTATSHGPVRENNIHSDDLQRKSEPVARGSDEPQSRNGPVPPEAFNL